MAGLPKDIEDNRMVSSAINPPEAQFFRLSVTTIPISDLPLIAVSFPAPNSTHGDLGTEERIRTVVSLSQIGAAAVRLERQGALLQIDA